jgi:hypothetical protein
MLERLSLRNFRSHHPDVFFWSAFLVLNFLLFLPMALLDEQSSLWPPTATFGSDWRLTVNQLFVWRANLDPWRISVEVTVLAAVWVSVRQLQRRWFGMLIGIAYSLALTYAVYEALILSVWLLEPSFYSQFYLARDGLPFLTEHVNVGWRAVVFGGLGLVMGAAAVVVLLRVLLRSGASPDLRPASRVVMGGLAALCVTAAATFQMYTARPEMVPSSLGFKLEKNIAASLKSYHDVMAFDDRQAQAAYNYVGYRLERKPDIYLIFVESYGSVLYKRSHFRPPYTALLRELETTLKESGWRAATALSESPTWGGGSWLSYTSTILGMHIDNHPQYLELRNRYQLGKYPNLGKSLQDQGYHFVWVSSLDENLSDLAWAKYTRFLGVDELIRNQQMEYIGPRYGWGSAPPDQWVLHWAHDRLQAATDKPLLFFTITQNSHYPWATHPTLVEDWRTLNQSGEDPTPVDPEALDLDTRRRYYLNAVEYQLRMLTQFIEDVGDEDSIFILIGDHQPPALSRRADGWSTPVHIISKNRAFVDAFGAYGFAPGLTVTDLAPTLRHEGFYSMFMRVLLGQYGAGQIAAPEYLPRGIMPGEIAPN